LLDHFERGRLLLNGVELLVIDEADRMLDMGFIPDIERICKLVPFTRQTLFFTATMPPEIRRITEQFLHNPVRVEVTRPATTVATTTQLIAKSGREPHEKRDTLRRLIRSADGLKNAIIFCNRKRDVATLFRSLLRHGFSVQALHGDMDQPARMAALEQFRKGEVTLLVASDVAARGLDILDVSHIYNFDVPYHPDDYVHRIGRTGRAGRSGTAITLVAGANDAKAVAAIEKLIGQPIAVMEKPVGQPPQRVSERPHAQPNGQPHGQPQGKGHGKNHGKTDGHHHPRRHGAPARSEEVRSRPAPPPRPRGEDADVSHLPAFLLRPVKV
jgi:superfamily II DNA/RNA helicase